MISKLEKECLVFSTSLQTKKDVEQISDILDTHPDISDWSVDLENWENVLRVEGMNIDPPVLTKKLRENGVFIRRMPTN